MQIEIHMPRLFDADVTYDEEHRMIVITPKMSTGIVPLLGVRTCSDKHDREMRSLIHFDLSTGKPTPPRTRAPASAASFDDLDPPSEDTNEP
jgi:hypothetical protein